MTTVQDTSIIENYFNINFRSFNVYSNIVDVIKMFYIIVGSTVL